MASIKMVLLVGMIKYSCVKGMARWYVMTYDWVDIGKRYKVVLLLCVIRSWYTVAYSNVVMRKQ